MKVNASNLNSFPRPRAVKRMPSYPRQLAYLGLALSVAASACGGPKTELVEPIAAGGMAEPYHPEPEPVPIATDPDYAQPPPDPEPDENIPPPGGPAIPYESGR